MKKPQSSKLYRIFDNQRKTIAILWYKGSALGIPQNSIIMYIDFSQWDHKPWVQLHRVLYKDKIGYLDAATTFKNIK